MSFSRFSVRAILLVVLLIAADCAAFRMVIWGYAPLGLVFGMFGIFPMVNLLAVVCYRGFLQRRYRRPFFVGFTSSGAVVVLIWLNVFLLADEKPLTTFLRDVNQLLAGMTFSANGAFI